jgi:PAS domain S-box-containing protein
MLEKIPTETIEAIFDALPVDITFVDKDDTVCYYSRHDDRIFRRTPAIIGRKVQNCHPKQSLDKVNEVVADLRSGQKKVAEFWIDLKGQKVYIRYFPVKDRAGKYIGIVEVSQDITDIQKIKGEKRLAG